MSKGSRICTFSGRFVDPLHLRASDIDIKDVAHHLSQQCRYSGATCDYYSVAQHSVLVSRLLRGTGYEWDGLHHDDSEAYLQDMARPLKEHPELGEAYRKIEKRIQHTVAMRFGLTWPEPVRVKETDTAILLAERRAFLPPITVGRWSPEIEAATDPGIDIESWTSKRAEREFLLRYEQLENQRDRRTA